ncbi:MAG: sugar phosphate isomerase/epimerase [Clostridia bacterium]|nr:sugar phosphate isomerase/epimerase [Clostridia bacterium]
MKLGVLVPLNNVEEEFKKVYDLGFNSCQLCCWEEVLMTDEMAELVNKSSEKYNVTVSTFWCGWKGPQRWNFYEGPLTLGLVPETYRYERSRELKKGSDFAKKINVLNIATHVGFIPETPCTAEYNSLVCCIRDIAQYVKNNGQYFLFETGQETPVTLRRIIEDVGTGNLGINLDPANLIMYGKANPVDALDIIGEFVRDIHGKDGCYPTNGRELGKETPLGEGKVNYPQFISRLREIGYDGAITIEREISGEKQISDIKNAKEYLNSLIN